MLKELFYYPKFHISNESYREYWRARKIKADSMNSFQKKRADLTLKYIEHDSVLMDIGVGNGAMLAYVNRHKPMQKMIGADFSPEVLSMAGQNGVETIQADISSLEVLKKLPSADYVFFYEVLEHIAKAEEILDWAFKVAGKGVFFSVPNTGYFVHRLRLLLGRFPLQWRVKPDEHLRFWTVKDMCWWLAQLGYNHYRMELYEGPSVLNKLWPSLFARGIWVYIPKRID